MNSPTPLPDSSLDWPFQTDSAPLEGPRRHSILDKNSRLSAVRPAEIQEECPKSPALFLASASKHGSEAAVLDLSVHEESKFTENKILLKRNMAALKPAIAPQVGTTRTVLLSKRPEPKKPQSMRPITQSRPRAPKTTAAKEPGPTAVKSQPHRSSPRPPLARAPQTPGSESSEDSEDSDASHSSDTSDESERGKLKRRLGKKGGEVRTESRRPTPLLQSTPTDGGQPGSSAGSSRTRGVRSAAELLEEAEDIARTDPSIHERRVQQRQPEGATLAVKTLMRGRARTVDEIIASLQAGSATDSLSASDLMIKELTERVLGHETEGEISDLKDDPTSGSNEGPKESAAETLKSEAEDTQSGPPPGTSTGDVPPPHVSIKVAEKKGSAGLSADPQPSSDAPLSCEVVSSQTVSLKDSVLGCEQDTALERPEQVTYSDIISVKGVPVTTARGLQKSQPVQQVSFLATWTPKTNKPQLFNPVREEKIHVQEYKTIHHLCTAPLTQVLPLDLQSTSRLCHSPSRRPASLHILPQGAASSRRTDPAETHWVVSEGERCAPVYQAEQKDGVVLLPTHNDLTEWQKIAEYYVERPRMVLLGRQASMYTNESKLFWNPAPPKFTFTPSFVQDKLFPKYQGSGNEMPNVLPDLYCDLQDLNESDQDLLDVQNKTVEEKSLSRNCRSLMDLHSEYDAGLQSPRDVCPKAVIWRSQSAPDLSVLPDSGLRVPADFKAIKKEVDVVIKQLSQSKTAAVSEARSPTIPVSKEAESIPADLPEPVGSQSQLMQRQKKENVSLSDVARKAGQTYIIHPRKKSTRKKKLSPEKLAFVERKLNQPPRTLARCESLPALQRRTDPSLRVPKKTLRSRRASLPALLDFEHFAAARGGIPEDAIPREWVRDIWDSWFDEVFPPSDVETGADYPRPTPLYPERRSSIDTRHTDAEGPVPDEVDLSCTLGAEVTASDLQSEVDKLTQVIAAQRGSGAFDLCRRGALLKKLGHLTLALEDLNTVIAREPLLLDAYWHRHSIHLLKRNLGKALEDLNFIIKHNRNHADAFRSKAEIYRAQGDSTLAIINYTQAIKRGPEDDENYFRRAEMYEKTNETLLAMEDYAMAFTINPRRTDALMIHGLHHFRRSNWTVALSDFTALLKQEPRNVEARTYRGRTYAKLSQHREAIEDLSAAIYLDRNNWVAFYLRGCLLRKVHPEMAIKDLSASVLINDSFENLSAFLHRGVLYAEQSRWASAVGDFERVLKLDRCVPVAHVNLGLVYMLKMENHSEAIRRFTNALKVDPTYIRAHICRAQAYAKVRDLPRALKDITHAIHLQPNTHHLYIMRGQYLCDMKDFELARFCIRYAAEMNKALGSSPIQQAAVQSFLGNNARAIACLSSATRTRPSPSAFILLGKTQMKARKYTDAIESFEKVLTPLCPDRDCCSAPDAAEVFYLTGLCHVAQANLLQAVEAFSSAVKISPDSADALYQRGLCRMHLQQSKCVQDFNRALSINPNLFQVYLSRAAFYGSKGRFSKAILNCNEALRIQPRSVRAYLYRGALKFFMKIYRYAVQDLTTAIEIDETCSLAYYNRGVCYQQMKEHGKALKDYGRVQHLGSRKEVELKVLINRGLLYVELNDPNNALQDFKAASRKSPEDASNFHAVGVLHHRLGHLEEATAAFTQALRLRPFFLEAYVGRGNVYMDYGHQDATKQAQRDFLTALHLNPTCAKARLGLAFNFQVLGRFSKAWNQLTIAIEVDPSCWAAYEGRSVINLQMGHTFSAFQDINAALKYNPLSDQLITNRGVINQFMGDKVNAMKDYQAAIAHNPQYALAYFNAANLYFYNRQFEQASEYYSKAFDLDPSDDSAALNRAIARTLLGNVPEALRDFSAACKLNPFSTHVYFNRANLYISVKKYKSAEKDLSQALLLQPNDALVYKLRADVRGKLGSTELAVSDYKKAVRLEEAAQGV